MQNRENRTKKIEQRIKSKQQPVVSGKLLVFILFSVFYSLNTVAQCAMCRASLESTGNATQAEAVNDGIVYLMAIPYILVAVIGVFIYKMFYGKGK
jgi:heme/copper-type cytochrome/quinol oxidase subunit 2